MKTLCSFISRTPSYNLKAVSSQKIFASFVFKLILAIKIDKQLNFQNITAYYFPKMINLVFHFK